MTLFLLFSLQKRFYFRFPTDTVRICVILTTMRRRTCGGWRGRQ